jgi:Flp pilus assembly protein TadD
VRIWTELGATQQYYPVVHTVFWVEHRVFGDSTLGYHLVNILLHGLSALLLVAVLRRLDVPGAWLAGWLFALHPVMVESVAWITELKNALSGALLLATALAYLSFDGARTRRTYALSVVFFIFGLLAKSAMATLPGALLIVLWWKKGRVALKRDVVPLLPFFALGLASGLFTAWVERRFIGAVGEDFALSAVDRFLIAGRAVWFYLWKLVLPLDLTFIYPRWRIDSRAAWQYLFLAGVVVAFAICFALRRRSRAPLAVFAFFVVMLFPSLGFFNVYPFRYSFVADHFQYLAAIGPMAALAASMDYGTGRLGRAIRPAARGGLYGVVLVACFLLTQSQSSMYADAATLYRTTIQRNPTCWMAHYNLGILLTQAGHLEEAKAHYGRALELNPAHVKAHINLGIALAKTGHVADALEQYRQALGLDPRSAEAHYNLGYVLADAGRAPEAAAQYEMALAADPKHADAHNNLAVLLAAAGRSEEAVAHYRKSIELRPNDRETLNNLGILFVGLGRADDAIMQFRRALEISPNYAEAHNNLGIQLAKIGQTDEALMQYGQALQSDPLYPEAHANIGLLLSRMGRLDEATIHDRKALELSPGAMGALENLALSLGKMGRPTEATDALQRALDSARAAGDEHRANMIVQIATRIGASWNQERRSVR